MPPILWAFYTCISLVSTAFLQLLLDSLPPPSLHTQICGFVLTTASHLCCPNPPWVCSGLWSTTRDHTLKENPFFPEAINCSQLEMGFCAQTPPPPRWDFWMAWVSASPLYDVTATVTSYVQLPSGALKVLFPQKLSTTSNPQLWGDARDLDLTLRAVVSIFYTLTSCGVVLIAIYCNKKSFCDDSWGIF